MKIACIGGGPAGLYFAISMKLRDPRHEVHVFERNRPDDTFGWGVVFSDQTVENLMANDPASGAVIRDEFAHWDDIEVHIHESTIAEPLWGSFAIRFSTVWSEKTTPQPNVSSGRLRSNRSIWCAGSRSFIEIAK